MTQTSINYGIVLYELSVPGEAVEASRRILEEVKELSKILESPVVPFEEKEKVISRIFPEEMKNFLCVVCKYAHAALLPEIFQAYQDYYNEQHKILTADLYCVVPPSQKQLEGIRKFLLKRFQTQDAKIRIIKDESLVGGFLIRTRDQELDYSLKGRINALQQKLIWR